MQTSGPSPLFPRWALLAALALLFLIAWAATDAAFHLATIGAALDAVRHDARAWNLLSQVARSPLDRKEQAQANG